MDLAQLTVEQFMQMFSSLGAVGILAWYFLRRAQKSDEASAGREERMAAAITKLEEFQRSQLMEIIKENAAAIARTNDTLAEIGRVFGQVPCVMAAKTGNRQAS